MSRRKQIGVKAAGFSFDAGSLAYYREHPVEFIERFLINPETDRPFDLLDAERAFIAHAFKTDNRGRLIHRTWIYGAIKKSGKTVFGSMLVIVTVLLFGGGYAEGYCIANDLEQALSRTFEMCVRIIEASPILKAEAQIFQDRIEFPATVCGAASPPAQLRRHRSHRHCRKRRVFQFVLGFRQTNARRHSHENHA
jgi:hypothetical protein